MTKTNVSPDAIERFSLLDLSDGPRDRAVPECPTCGDRFGENLGCPVCNAYRHAEARRLAGAEEELAQSRADAAEVNHRDRQNDERAEAAAVAREEAPVAATVRDDSMPLSFSARNYPGSRSRRTRAWCRIVTGVKDDVAGRGVKRLAGEYVADGATASVYEGQVVVVVFHQGDEQVCRIFAVGPNGLRLHSEHNWRDYFDLVLADIRDLLGQEQPVVEVEPVEPDSANRTIEADLTDIVEEGQRIAGGRLRTRVATRTASRERRIERAQQSSVGSVQLTAGNVVAGAAAEGNYIMIGWAGGGELTVPFVKQLLTDLNYDSSFFPKCKSDHHHAGKAVNAVNHQGCISRSVSKGRQRSGREWQSVVARWKVGSAYTDKKDTRFGDRLFYVDLMKNGELRFTFAEVGNPRAQEVADAIRAEYARTVAEETLRSTDVSDWLKSLFVDRWNGAKLGGNWVVPHEHAQECERLVDAVSMHWGTDWMLPAIPVASGQAVARGIARGFIADVNDLFTKLEAQRAQYRNRGSDIGPQAAATYLAKLGNIAERARVYSEVLGADGLDAVRVRARALIEQLEPLASTTARRAANIWDDLVANGEVAPY